MRVLFLTHRLPYAPNRGDRLRAYHEIRVLSKSAEVHLASLVHDAEEAAHATDLRGMCASVTVGRVPWLASRFRAAIALAGTRPLTHLLLDSPELKAALPALVERVRPDAVFAFCTGMARFAMEPPLDRLPLLLDFVDVDSAKWASLAGSSRPPLSWIYAREHRTLARFEASAARHARHSVVVNERELDRLRALAPAARASVVTNGIDITYFRPPAIPAREPLVVLVGVMDYPPNVEGATWFARRVWPLVREARPDARFVIVGANPTERVKALAEGEPSITVTGPVDDVRPWLWRASVAVAPLHTAHGVQNKALEAVAAGVNTIVTSVVASGLPPAMRSLCEVHDAPPSFAAAVSASLARQGSRSASATSSLEQLTWESVLADLPDIVRGTVGSAATTPSMASAPMLLSKPECKRKA